MNTLVEQFNLYLLPYTQYLLWNSFKVTLLSEDERQGFCTIMVRRKGVGVIDRANENGKNNVQAIEWLQ